jgi:hypothetical protein
MLAIEHRFYERRRPARARQIRFSRVTMPTIFPPRLYNISLIQGIPSDQAKYRVPSSTDARIEALCERIRSLCGSSLTPESEDEIRRLAQELRSAIDEHVRLAKSSLIAKQAAITARDPQVE